MPSQFIPFSVPTSRMPSMTLSQSLNLSLAESPRMSGVRALLDIARAARAQAWVMPNPGVYIANNYGNSYLLGASLPIEPPWKLAFRLLVAKRQIEQAEIDVARQMWQFRGEVRRNYVQLVIAEETAMARNDLTQLTKRIWDSTRVQFDSGNVPGLDVRRAKLAYIQAKMDSEQAAVLAAQAREQLNIVMGKPPETTVNVPPLPDWRDKTKVSKSDLLPDFKNELPAFEKLLLLAKDNRPELKLARAAVRTNDANLKNAYGNIVPTPRFVTGWVKEINPPIGPITNKAFFQAYIDMPLLNWNQGDIARFRAMGRQLNLDVLAQENVISGQVSMSYHRVIAARQRLRTFLEEALPEAASVGEVSRHGYELGQTDLNTLLDAQRADMQIRAQYLDAVLAYQLAMNDLEQSVGVPFQ